MSPRVIFSPEALEQLVELFQYIAHAGSPDIADGYTEAIVKHCEGLAIFPLRGTKRDDVRPGLRITNYKKRTIIAFEMDDKSVTVMGIFYGGQDYESILDDGTTEH